MLEQKILNIKTEALEVIKNAQTEEQIFKARKKFLGRKAEFNNILKELKDLPSEEKKKIGRLANEVKKEIDQTLNKREKEIKSVFDFEKEKIDITIPGKVAKRGHLHPLTLIQNEIEDIFMAMGFEIADGPEVDTEFYVFDALNVPRDHPARDMQDTFWLRRPEGDEQKEKILLRTHTSSVQIRYMEKNNPPFRIIAPGRTFRNEATDASHEHSFHQFEALFVGNDINVGNLKFIAEQFFSRYYGGNIKVRLRPSYFPFVEPGFEIDISCTVCDGKGCSVCSQTGWIEIAGAGMVHQNVFVSAGYSRNEYQGFAWGFGLERLAMMKYKIDDIRLFHLGDLRFIQQF